MVFGRPKKEAKPDMRAEAVILELEWEVDDKSRQIVEDARAIIRLGMLGYVYMGVNSEYSTRWIHPSTKLILAFYWQEENFTGYSKRYVDVDMTEFNKTNLEEAQKKARNRPKGRRHAKR